MSKMGLNPLYIPHAVNPNVFRPINREEARSRLGKALNRDLSGQFIVVSNAMNKGTPSRKGFFETFSAFKLFSDRHPDTTLIMHTEIMGVFNGESMESHIKLVGLDPARVIFPPQYLYVTGQIGDDYLNDLYNIADVYLSTSHGEGFGVPIIEAQAAGCPAIVTDFSAMPELVRSGWKVPGFPILYAPGATQRVPVIGEVVAALESAYTLRDDAPTRNRALEVVDDYGVDTVFDRFMLPALRHIEAQISLKETALTDSRRRRTEKRRALLEGGGRE